VELLGVGRCSSVVAAEKRRARLSNDGGGQRHGGSGEKELIGLLWLGAAWFGSPIGHGVMVIRLG
jgi:hypothetical protein